MGERETPITTGSVIKWGGLVVAIVGAIVSGVWQLSALRSDAAAVTMETRGQIVAVAKSASDADRHASEVDRLSAERDARQQKDIDALKTRIDETQRGLAELQRKVDVMLTIVERIDKKLNQP